MECPLCDLGGRAVSSHLFHPGFMDDGDCGRLDSIRGRRIDR